MRRRFFVLFNPGAGRSRRAFLDQVVGRLTDAGAAVELCDAPDAASAFAEASARVSSMTVDAIVAAGGDGTVRQAARLIVNTPLPLGYIPLGTGNVLAHELALKRTPDVIAATLLRGPLQRVECGLANGALFLLMAGVGFDGRVIANLDAATKLRFGKLAYVPPMLCALAMPINQLDVEVDGKPHPATWVVVTKARCYGGHFVMAPQASLVNTGLHAVLFHSHSRRQLVRQLLALASGQLAQAEPDYLRARGIETISCTRVSVRSNTPTPYQIDGDRGGLSPLEISMGGGVVQLIVPRPTA
jgi:diacylglycerol kinase (ATP)